MQVARLNQMADFLDGLKLEEGQRFDMKTWGRVGTPTEPTLLQRVFGRAEPDCGTAACAIGWAMHHGVFPQLIRRRKTTTEGLNTVYDHMVPAYVSPTGATKIDWEAVVEFFGLTASAATYLFSQTSYSNDTATPMEVAARIREVVAAHQPTLSVVQSEAVAS